MASGADIARGWIEHSPFAGHLGIVLVSIEPDVAVLELPFAEHLATAGDMVHGGAISALVDTAAAASAWSGAEPTADVRWATVGFSVSFLAAARGEALTATGRVIRRGRSICFCEVDVATAGGKPVARGLVTYQLG